jgi:hypothetical protein
VVPAFRPQHFLRLKVNDPVIVSQLVQSLPLDSWLKLPPVAGLTGFFPARILVARAETNTFGVAPGKGVDGLCALPCPGCSDCLTRIGAENRESLGSESKF